ncbi:MAG: alginate lyase family protein [Candidatus Zixiibacteriota bacterium]
MLETTLMKKIGFKVVRKLKVVRAYAPQRRIDDAELLREIGADNTALRFRQFPPLFSGLTDSKLTNYISKRFSAECECAISVARNAARNRFDLLGSGLVDLGPQIDWLTDFKSGKSWDKRDYRLQKVVNLNDNSDVKVPWELSRCNHFLPMALAHAISGDESYPIAFANQVISWSEQNAYLQTVNWSCPMDTAIRCINWLTAFQIFAVRHKFSPEFESLLTVELYKGGKSIFENLEKAGDAHNTNHYLTNLLGLLFLGELFRNTTRPNNWRSFAVAEFEREMMAQIDSDGLDYESSLPYHGLVTEVMLLAYYLSTKSDFSFSQEFCVKLGAMAANLARFTDKDGLVENFGDNDDGRIFKMFWRTPRDYRDIVGLGVSILRDCNLPQSADIPERIAMGIDVVERNDDDLQPRSSVRLTESGICQMRSKDLTVNFFANPIGTAGLGNHKHNDLLSFTLNYQGAPIFVDPGSYVYTVDEELRNQFRSTRSHNTVVVDGCEQNRMVGGLLFLLRTDGTPRISEWKSNAEFDLVTAEHDCYSRLDDPVVHRRSLYLCKITQTVLVRDELAGKGPHRLEFNFHIDDMKIEAVEHHLIQIKPENSVAGLLFANCDAASRFQISTDWISPSYGVKYPAMSVTQAYEGKLPYKTVFGITPIDSADIEATQRQFDHLRAKLQW